MSNDKDKAYDAWVDWAGANQGKYDGHLPKYMYTQNIKPGISVHVMEKFGPLGHGDLATRLRMFTRQLNNRPEEQLKWIGENYPAFRSLMRDIANWAKEKKHRLDLKNILNYMERADGTVVIIDPVA